MQSMLVDSQLVGYFSYEWRVCHRKKEGPKAGAARIVNGCGGGISVDPATRLAFLKFFQTGCWM